MCKIFTKEKIKSNLAQKLLSMAVSLSLMLAMVPNNGAFAEGQDKFVTSARANHWGRSDLRAYLNNVPKSDNTLPIDSTTSGSNSANYPSQFSEAEYKLVQPFTYSTNVLDGSATATAVYETTDKFWLPSGNYNNNQIISWGSGDISANSQYSQTTTNDKDRIIPISYWSYGNPTYSWLRSPNFSHVNDALGASRGYAVYSYNVNHSNAAAAACKIHLESVIFASAASAASIAAAGGAKKIDISGSSDFGKKTSNSLPDYGMYLKTSSSSSFSPTGLSLSGTNLTVNYSGGVAGQYVVVHAFKEDSLTGGHTSYVAAKELEDGQSSATINVSNWGIDSLDGYTIKVWMEDGSGSLAKATMPVTFVGTEKKEDGASTNARVFAMKADLQTSWGTLTNATDLVGANPTNQKIYFGSNNGSPLEFWIAGRETAANGGNISATGNIMTLYQAKSLDETRKFNESKASYKENPTLALQDGQSITYTGSPAVYPSSSVTYKNVAGTKLELPENNPTYQYSTDGGSTWTDGMPTNAGTYKIRAKVVANGYYESATSAPVTFIIDKKSITPQITAENKDYDGTTEAHVSVTFDGLIDGETLDKDVDYTIDSATFANANAGENKTVTVTFTFLNNTTTANNYTLSKNSATATANITKKSITVTADAQTKIEGEADPELTYTVDGLIEGDSLTGNLVREEGETPGTYNINLGTLENPNYEITFIPGTFTIAETPSYPEAPSDKPENPEDNSETEQPSDRPEWGETMITIKEIKHYISTDGSRSVEISPENTDKNGIIWLKEESFDPYLGYDTAAWYGFDNSDGVFENGSRAYVHWYNKEQNPEKFDNIDETHEIDSDNFYYFEVGVIRPDGTQYTQLSKPVNFYVQIGDDWDKDDLQAYYITQRKDETIPVKYDTTIYPEGTDEFGVMTLSHFSPYFIYDKLTDEEKAAFDALSDEEKAQLDAAAKELAAQQEEKTSEASETSNDESTKTGDEITYFTVSGLGLIMTLALGLMLKTKINKKKSD